MQSPTKVIVYGNTLSMAGIAASLKAVEDLEVICVDPCQSIPRTFTTELFPQAIIFDRTQPHPELDLALLREQPGLTLIGVDPSSDEALVLSGQLSRVLSIRDLTKLVSENPHSEGD